MSEEETWNEIPEANRLAVEAAASALGLALDGLPARFESALPTSDPEFQEY